MNSFLHYIFEPKSVAVIGASAISGTVGRAIFSHILQGGFKGNVYPVNPKYKEILNVQAFATVLDIPGNVDLAIICVPVMAVEEVMNQCAQKNIKGAVLITAGFKETGEEGKLLENKIAEIAKYNYIDLIGPNCLGIVNTYPNISLNANFAFDMPQRGNVALISQSGAVGIVAMDYAGHHDLGISKFISIGNKAVLDESDILEYLLEDDDTRIITMYIEDISRPEVFFAMANKAAARQKPIIVIKAGTSLRGAIATRSHTGALSSSDIAYDSLFAQCGVIRVETLAEVFEYAKGLTCLKQPKGNRVAVLTNAGGMGIITTDALEKNRLEMTDFTPETISSLKEALPPLANIHNPVDIIGDASAQRFCKTLTIIGRDRNVDAILVSVASTARTDMNAIAQALCDFSKANPDIPILTNLVALINGTSFISILDQQHIPNFDFPEISVRVLAAMINYYKWIKQPHTVSIAINSDKEPVKLLLENCNNKNMNTLTEPESYEMLKAYGISIPDYRIVANSEQAVSAASQIGYPVVLKIVSPDILHKTDVGGVKINLTNETELKKAFGDITKSVSLQKPAANIEGILVEEFFTQQGIEIIIGAQYIKGFGHLIMYGLGGTFVELFKDVSFRLAPLTKEDALSMIQETKGYQILKGYRGHTPYDINAIVDYLLRVSQLVTDFPMIKELDVNPLKVLEGDKGLIVLDAKITV